MYLYLGGPGGPLSSIDILTLLLMIVVPILSGIIYSYIKEKLKK
jgi:hypothetical protein